MSNYPAGSNGENPHLMTEAEEDAEHQERMDALTDYASGCLDNIPQGCTPSELLVALAEDLAKRTPVGNTENRRAKFPTRLPEGEAAEVSGTFTGTEQ